MSPPSDVSFESTLRRRHSGYLAIHCYDECVARLCPARVINDVRKASGKLLDLLPKSDVRPAGLQEKYDMTSRFPSRDLVGIAANRHITGKNYPTAFAR